MDKEAPELAAKLNEIYPELGERGLVLDLEYSKALNFWGVKIAKGRHRLHTLLNKEDADACLRGARCEQLGAQINRFAAHFE